MPEMFSAPQLYRSVHEDLQPDLHDVAGGPLVGLPPVPSSNAPGFPLGFLGCNQRTPGRVPWRNLIIFILVHQHGERVHEDLQPDLHDAAGGPLVGLPPVFSPDVARVSIQQLGCY